MGLRKIVKDFILTPTWDEATASRMEAFLNHVVGAQTVIRSGTYVGTGRALTIPVPDLTGPPMNLDIQHPNGTISSALAPTPAGVHVTGWNQKGFTVGTSADVNTPGVTYTYLVHS